MVLAVYLIIGVTVFVAVGLIALYTLAVVYRHVNPFWCYISYTGNYPVESCLFSLLFNLCSAVYMIIVFLRYVQLVQIIEESEFSEKKTRNVNILNLIGLLLGIIGAFGFSMTGCFQQRIFHLLHIIGVIACSYFTLGYLILQTFFTFFLPPLATSKVIKILRLLISCLTFLILAFGFFFGLHFISRNEKKFEILSSNAAESNDLGQKIGSVLEWMLFILNQMFICSFCPDFKKIALKKDKIVFL